MSLKEKQNRRRYTVEFKEQAVKRVLSTTRGARKDLLTDHVMLECGHENAVRHGRGQTRCKKCR